MTNLDPRNFGVCGEQKNGYFSRRNLVATWVDLRRALDREPSTNTANALTLVGEDLRFNYGIDLRPYYSEADLPKEAA